MELAAMILGPKDEPQEDDGYVAVCAELLSALEAKDAKALNKALGAYFEMKEASPHEEGEHIEEE
jgi:hypothetical protein